MTPRRHWLRQAGTLATMAALAPAAVRAQAWPSKPIKLIVVYPTGGVSDSAARLVAEKLAASLGQPVVVENRGGANGNIGMEAMLRSPADGYTLAFAAVSPLTINPHVMRVPYDPLRDVLPVASLMYSPVYLVATPAFPGKTFADLVSIARAQPGRLNMGTSGVATVGHLMLEQLNRSAKIQINHVPYKGGGQVISDAVGGQFDLMTTNPSPAVNGFIAQGKLRVLAVTGSSRLPSFPDAPTLAELGHSGANMTSTFGFFAQARLPGEILRRLNTEINKVLAMPEVTERLVKQDNVMLVQSPERFAQLVQTQHREIGALVQEIGLKPE